jgi:CO/xanthine dehydrogenase FAD-binding subunit
MSTQIEIGRWMGKGLMYHGARAPPSREMTMRRFDLALPTSLDDCLTILAGRGGEATLVAGGTDLLPQMKNGVIRPALVVDLSGVPELRQIQGGNGRSLRIGAAVSAREAAPAADRAPPLMALGAEAVIAGPGGQRRVPLEDFFTGVRKTVLASNEVLVELIVPSPGPRSGGQYQRHTPRRELDIAVVGVAAQLTLTDGRCTKARIALASVAPTPVRAVAAERALEGHAVTPETIERAAALAVEAARPISDQRGSADFRRHLVRVLTRRTLTTARERASA